jgi:hypothetical protein
VHNFVKKAVKSLENKGILTFFRRWTTTKNSVDKNVNSLWKGGQPQIES